MNRMAHSLKESDILRDIRVNAQNNKATPE